MVPTKAVGSGVIIATRETIMKLLLFSDLHCDLDATKRIVDRSGQFDLLLGAGDFASARRHLRRTIDLLRQIRTPTALVPGNSESEEALKKAWQAWKESHVLHGSQVRIDGTVFFGIGGGIPITPFGAWSYDFSEYAAKGLLRDCPTGCVLISHSPPKGVLDLSSDGRRLGSQAVRGTIKDKQPELVVCGHIHGSAGQSSRLGKTTVINAGPRGIIHDIDIS